MISRMIAIGGLAGLVSGCSVDCSNYVSMAHAEGRVNDGAADLASVIANAQNDEMRGIRSVGVIIAAPPGATSTPLLGHLRGARLVAPDGAVLREIPIPPAPLAPTLLVSDASVPDVNSYAVIRDALVTGRARVILDTDLPGRERLETVLSTWNYVPTSRRSCPYT